MCKHFECQAQRAAELAAISDRTGQPRYLFEATEIYRLDSAVECRRPVSEPT